MQCCQFDKGDGPIAELLDDVGKDILRRISEEFLLTFPARLLCVCSLYSSLLYLHQTSAWPCVKLFLFYLFDATWACAVCNKWGQVFQVHFSWRPLGWEGNVLCGSLLPKMMYLGAVIFFFF